MADRKTRTLRVLPMLLLGVFAMPLFALAGNIDITPKVIDVKGKIREISHHGITLKNNSAAIQSVFIWSVDVDGEKGDLSKADMSGMNANPIVSSPSRWLEISRLNQVLPGEEQTVPLQLQIPAAAKPGMYHVSLKFSYGTTQSEAMACVSCTQETQLNIEVAEDIREKLQLFSFTAAKNIFINPSADFSFAVENTGNRALIPNGKIRIFDNTGKEVGLVDVNSDGKQVEPKARQLLAATWAAGGHFGKYKAMLDMSYGQRGTMQDVVYFWVIPWSKMFGFMLVLVVLAALLALFARGRDMARPSYSYVEKGIVEDERYDNSAEESEEEGEGLFTRIAGRFRAQDEPREAYVRESVSERLTEVNIPARIRTVPPQSYAVSLEQKVRTVSPDHIVRLR